MNTSLISYKDSSNAFCYESGPAKYPTKLIPHTHTNYEIYYFLEGEITYLVEGKHYCAVPHDLFITNSRELHCPLLNLDKSYSRQFIQFESHFISPLTDAAYQLLSPLENRPLGHLNKIDHTLVHAYGIDCLFTTLAQKVAAPDKYTDLDVKLLLNQILVTIKRIFDQHVDDVTYHPTDDKIYGIIKFINDHISTHLLVEDIANQFFMNKYYLSHYFKKSTGFSIKEYITTKRIMLAKDLISKGVPITSVCYDVGFNDYSCFYKAFTKLENKSPKTFFNELLPTLEIKKSTIR